MSIAVDPWLVIAGGVLVTYLIRFLFFGTAGRLQLPVWLQRALRYVPAAVFPALIVPGVLYPKGTLDVSLGNERIAAALIAILVAWRTNNTILTLISAIAAFFGVPLFFRAIGLL